MLKMRAVFAHTYGHIRTFLCGPNASCTVHTHIGEICLVQQCPPNKFDCRKGNFNHPFPISRNHRMVIFQPLSLVLKIQLECKVHVGRKIFFVLFNRVLSLPTISCMDTQRNRTDTVPASLNLQSS